MSRHIDKQAENRVPQRTGDNRVDPESLDNMKETQRNVAFGDPADSVFDDEREEAEVASEDLNDRYNVQSEEMDVGRITKQR
jgi:hypothetical protein